jgi:hypothetical protein
MEGKCKSSQFSKSRTTYTLHIKTPTSNKFIKIENITQFPWIMNSEKFPYDPIYHGRLIDLILIQKKSC